MKTTQVLNKIKQEKGLTNREIADIMDVEETTVQKWGSGINDMKSKDIERFCVKFGIEPNLFFDTPFSGISASQRFFRRLDSEFKTEEEVYELVDEIIGYNPKHVDDIIKYGERAEIDDIAESRLVCERIHLACILYLTSKYLIPDYYSVLQILALNHELNHNSDRYYDYLTWFKIKDDDTKDYLYERISKLKSCKIKDCDAHLIRNYNLGLYACLFYDGMEEDPIANKFIKKAKITSFYNSYLEELIQKVVEYTMYNNYEGIRKFDEKLIDKLVNKMAIAVLKEEQDKDIRWENNRAKREKDMIKCREIIDDFLKTQKEEIQEALNKYESYEEIERLHDIIFHKLKLLVIPSMTIYATHEDNYYWKSCVYQEMIDLLDDMIEEKRDELFKKNMQELEQNQNSLDDDDEWDEDEWDEEEHNKPASIFTRLRNAI